MLEGAAPRLFGLPPGADFPAELVIGLEQRLKDRPPEALARVELFVNTRRMQRRIRALLTRGGARLLPRIRLITDLSNAPGEADLPPPVRPLRRRLELAQLVEALLTAHPELAPRAAAFDLADSLAALMDEMQGEGVAPEVLHGLDVSEMSAHWARSRAFIDLVERYVSPGAAEPPDAEGRRRQVIERLAARWETDPPAHPVIVAGSTGSRGATALFMQAVARLPQGALVLPGFDFDQPAQVWAGLDDAMTAEDHPQYRFRLLMEMLGAGPGDVRPWHARAAAPCPARNRLVSLALRPAPVTDQWRDEGRGLSDMAEATADMTLIEAPSPRTEAAAIAARLRKARQDGVTAALITPDRMLTRQVTAALDRWGIEPDDSAGVPLPLSAPGRFLRQVAALFGAPLTGAALLALLKHPLAASVSGVRGPHMIWTRELELSLRRHGPAFPDAAALVAWAAKRPEDGRAAWADWLAGLLAGLAETGARPLEDHLAAHLALAEALAAGPGGEGSGALWDEAAGREARKACTALADAAPHGGSLTPTDYASLFQAVLQRDEVRNPVEPDPGVMIWGTLEARVQGADLVILGGLNEGVWPESAPPDPWLNRQMRVQAGLLLPERRIGLSAHDFQQAVAAREVVLSRAVRNAEAETVPSRWLNRLQNLMGGLDAQGGPEALKAMRARGADWVRLGAALDRPDAPVPPCPRPSPRPPVEARPKKLPVTGVERLIRDPYAIYARYILNLRPLDPLTRQADAPLRGTLLHEVLERFLEAGIDPDPAQATADLLRHADEVFAEQAPWPAARRLWRARLARVAGWFLAGEARRSAQGRWIALERWGEVPLANGFTLSAEADRIDRLTDGRLAIYDYKTGTPPTLKSMEAFDKQLLLEAGIAERGGFKDIPAAPVAHVAYLGLGAKPAEVVNTLADGLTDRTWEELTRLTGRYQDRALGYTARNHLQRQTEVTDYDGLSRYGEWDESQPPEPEEVGE
ncbi:ATP-dependent helicase/nuclease subunit B [Rhodovulum iodosum]|uniref:ATP-dependent helicase/nuclease subunit B n=1 Tax=Rhodovulum iodosum TaxID=68291 RepID=A0ABV3XRK7_9RHOB|nr:double-strand break repair protein AddB [Rhodovulum robiginosum]RSK30306.1 double-strand break repair protein AddB [Rhodovulum robiginosum]